MKDIPKMNVLAVSLLFALAEAAMVELNSEWRPNFGWEVTCKWSLYANDSLQSVRLYRGKEQFMIYRPERDGSSRSAHSRLPDMDMHVDCYETQGSDVTGKCIMALEIFQPITNDLQYTCEVSGERPTFRQEEKTINIEALVPPSEAVIVVEENNASTGRTTLNCTSTGLPAPTLTWTIGEQKIPQDYSSGAWNATSKLYHIWSTLSYTPANSEAPAVCSPEIFRGRVVVGTPAKYSGAGAIGVSKIILGILTVLALTS